MVPTDKKSGKRLFAFLYPIEMPQDISDVALITAWEDPKLQSKPIRRLTPQELADILNADVTGLPDHWVRFIEYNENKYEKAI